MTFRIAHEQDGSHRYTMATGKLLGRSTAGEGAVEEIDTATLLGVYVLKAGDTMTGTLVNDDGSAGNTKHHFSNGGYIILPRTTTGGWARGMRVIKASDGTTELGGAGFYGNNESLICFSVGFSSSWYVASAFEVRSGGHASHGAFSPSAWGSPKVGLELAQAGTGICGDTGATRNAALVSNLFYDGANWKVVGTAAQGAVDIATGGFSVYHNASASAGATATFTLILSGSKGNSIALQGASSQAGTGITFPATQSASSNANTLDDYEEGSFTAYDASGASLGNVGTLYYTKIGRLVNYTGTITMPTTANTNNVRLGGGPFAEAASTWVGGSVAAFTSTGTEIGMMINGTDIYGYDPITAAARSYLDMSGATVYALSHTFFTT